MTHEAGDGSGPSDLAVIERWFISRGLPHFIADYRAGPDVWSRSLWALAVAYVAGGLNGLELARWSALRNLVAAGAVVLLAVGTWVAANLVRRRPWSNAPEIGLAELAVFVVAPAIPSVVFGAQWGDAVQSVAEGVAVLLTIYVVTSYGIVPMTRWAVGRAIVLIAHIGSVVARAVPLLLLVVAFLFLAAEPWQVMGGLDGPLYPVVLSLFILLGAGFLIGRVPRELAGLAAFASWTEVHALITATPAAALCDERRQALDADPPDTHPLGRRQWLNVGLVTLLPQAVQITAVALVVAAFFVLFGFLTIPLDVTRSWMTDPTVDAMLSLSFADRTLVMTAPLLRVSGFLGAFTGLYFTVYLATDATYRAEFRTDVVAEVGEAFAVRQVYLAHRLNDG